MKKLLPFLLLLLVHVYAVDALAEEETCLYNLTCPTGVVVEFEGYLGINSEGGGFECYPSSDGVCATYCVNESSGSTMNRIKTGNGFGRCEETGEWPTPVPTMIGENPPAGADECQVAVTCPLGNTVNAGGTREILPSPTHCRANQSCNQICSGSGPDLPMTYSQTGSFTATCTTAIE